MCSGGSTANARVVEATLEQPNTPSNSDTLKSSSWPKGIKCCKCSKIRTDDRHEVEIDCRFDDAEEAESEAASDGDVARADDPEGSLPAGVMTSKLLSREAAADMVLDALTLQYLQTGGKRSKRERCRDEINRIIFAETPEGRKDPLMDEEQHELRRHCEQQQARTAKWSLTRFPTESHVVVELDNIAQRWKRYTMRHELDRSGQDLCNDLIARFQNIYPRPQLWEILSRISGWRRLWSWNASGPMMMPPSMPSTCAKSIVGN